MMKKYISLVTICTMLSVVALAQSASDESKNYGSNLLTISPFVGYATPQISDLGVGFAYERFLNDYISAKLPVNFGLSTEMFQTGLGLKFYPAGHRRAVKYAVGPTLIFTSSNGLDYITEYDNINNIYFTREVKNPLTQIGFVLNNSLNVTIQKNIYIGVEMGLGLNYLNNYQNEITYNQWNYYNYPNEDPNVLFLFNLALGYRF